MRDIERMGGEVMESFENAIKRAMCHETDEMPDNCPMFDSCGNCDTCLINAIKDIQAAHDHELEQARKAEFARGYEDGRRSKDADHAAAALRLSRLIFDGGSHENLSKIAYAVYPCATGWTCESSKGLRDRLIDLLGGVHEHRCDAGRDCARGDSRACGVGEPAKTITYDVLGNERHKAVCELRKLRERDVKIWNIEISIALGLDLDASNDNVCDRLIYLLGGDAPVMDEGPSDG